MNEETLKAVARVAEKLGHVFVVTADERGTPHVAIAGKLSLDTEGHVAVTAWFCTSTVSNLQVNKNLSLIVWDSNTDTGYQLLGESEKVEDLAMLDGYVPETEGKSPVPQVERRLLIRVNKITVFTHAPHTDSEI